MKTDRVRSDKQSSAVLLDTHYVRSLDEDLKEVPSRYSPYAAMIRIKNLLIVVI